PAVASLVFAMTSLSGGAASGRQARNPDEDVRDRFVGAWRLVWLEEEDADGKDHRADCTGMLVFTRESRVSVQVMYQSTQPAPRAGPVQYAQGGYEASFGRYEVDSGAHTFTYHVEGALVRGLIGQDLMRRFELSDSQLIVTSANPNEHWRVAWEH